MITHNHCQPKSRQSRLVTAVCLETHDEWAVAERRYLSEESMAKLADIRDDDPPQEAPLAIPPEQQPTDVAHHTDTAEPHHTAGRDLDVPRGRW